MDKDIPSLFGSMVFNDTVMQQKLPQDIYKALKKTIAQGTHLELDIANSVATAMKEWATEKGATHFTHWFQPMTDITAEKHDSFIIPVGDGRVIMDFSGKELVRGEPDASSFPSGGLRATFEARGYTAWDPTSYAFIKDGTLCIPTAFYSYSGESLDKKTPLLRSMDAMDRQAKRILKLFGNTKVKRVITTVGAEQEYFLIDRELYKNRPDLVYCGRTLFGSRPSKGQELEDHYFGIIKTRVSAFMKELDEELWKLGVLSKTKHNEVAPAQHELAPIFSTTNIATDHNQLTMEMMKRVALKHGLTCLLHEKPFAGVNGSGKHNNWSLSTDTGTNLLEPGDTPFDNAQFLLFLVAVIKAVDDYQDLLRVSVAGAGNDHRLGGNEAPPAIVSIFIGEELAEILDAIEQDNEYKGKKKISMEVGATVLPHIPRDNTDRNRTSPFAFTGNKFEFRMPGSTMSVSGPNTVLNAAVADVLGKFADELEGAENFMETLRALIKRVVHEHKRIIFNGNGYDESWVIEAEKRGLLNLKTTPDAIPSFIAEKNVAMFERLSVYTRQEVLARYDIYLDTYSKKINIEALTFVDIVNRIIFPSVINYQNDLAALIERKKNLGNAFSTAPEESKLSKLCRLTDDLCRKTEDLEKATSEAHAVKDNMKLAIFYRDSVLSAISALRVTVDELELLVSKEHWKMPTYGDLLYSVD